MGILVFFFLSVSSVLFAWRRSFDILDFLFVRALDHIRGNKSKSSRTHCNNTQSLAFHCQDKRQALRA